MTILNSSRQFIIDGLVGVATVLISFGMLSPTLISPIFISQGKIDWSVFFGDLFFFRNSIISPMPFVILIGFISMGIGGRSLENITTRLSWVKPMLIISAVSWILGILLISILFYWEWAVVGFMAVSMSVGFLIASLAGVLFNPTKRLLRLVIGAVASTIVSYTLGILIILFQISY